MNKVLSLYYALVFVTAVVSIQFILTTDKLQKYTPPKQSSSWKYCDKDRCRVPHWYRSSLSE